MMKQKYTISGMTCSACSSHVEKSVSKVVGVKVATVNLLTNSMQIEYDETLCREKQIIEAVENAGYGAELQLPAKINSAEQKSKSDSANARIDGNKRRDDLKGEKENSKMRTRLWISIIFLILLMFVSMHHMVFGWLNIEIPNFLMKLFHGNENALTYSFTQLLLVLPIVYVNRIYYQKGLKSLLHLHPNMDSLIAIGSGAALLYGIVAIYRIGYGLGHANAGLVSQYVEDLYFESAGMILTLITVGKFLEAKSKGKTGEAIMKLMDLSPKKAIRLTGKGLEEEIPSTELMVNDIFVIKPGALIPADGIIIEGTSSINEAAITGESIPVEKRPGDKVITATINKAGRLICKAVRVGDDTTLSQIIKLVEEASSSKAPIAKLADKIAGIFVPTVMGIALLTFIVWLATGGRFETAMSCAIAVLVISCPCALGLATPVAIMVGTGVGASYGILIKTGDVLQMTGKVNTVVLDKTGTITEGIPHVTDVLTFQKKYTREQILRMLAAIEKPSEHPLAEAIMEEAAKNMIEIPEVTDFKAFFGKGVKGKSADGQVYLAGNNAFFKENNIELTTEQETQVTSLAREGKTPLLFGCNNELLAVIAVADTIRSTTREAIKQLRKMNIDIVMLTGDNIRTAEAVREKLGIGSVIAEVLPQEKEKQIRNLKKKGKIVAMVGDGVNDAPALMAANVGIAIGAGTDIAIDSADIILMKNQLTEVITAIRLSRSVIRNIKENLFWAFFYNSVGIPLAAGLLYPGFGLKLSPMFGALAMSLSSLFVVGNALRLKKFKANVDKINKDEISKGEISKDEINKGNISKGEISKDEISNDKVNENKGEMIMEKTIFIEGMSCGHCTARVQKALEELQGGISVEMNLEGKTAKITCKDEIADDTLRKVITNAGYEVVDIQ